MPRDKYLEIFGVRARFGLDFDDAYQYLIASTHSITLATLDQDFRRAEESDLDILFL